MAAVGSSGGSSTQTLSINNVPKHNHDKGELSVSPGGSNNGYIDFLGFDGDGSLIREVDGTICKLSSGTNNSDIVQNAWATQPKARVNFRLEHSHSLSGSTGYAGKNADNPDSFSIMPPYESAYCWKRTS